ncbi:hypothetical protein [Nonomuraea salmonea]|uniref:hypothetical protein n=1 Tax=Nonomuraea salmonea TaxID=46181 RepID=UPI003CD081D4
MASLSLSVVSLIAVARSAALFGSFFPGSGSRSTSGSCVVGGLRRPGTARCPRSGPGRRRPP